MENDAPTGVFCRVLFDWVGMHSLLAQIFHFPMRDAARAMQWQSERSCQFSSQSVNPIKNQATPHLPIQPRTTNHEPRTKNREPRTANHQPRTANREPRTKNQEPSPPAATYSSSLHPGRALHAGFPAGAVAAAPECGGFRAGFGQLAGVGIKLQGASSPPGDVAKMAKQGALLAFFNL